MYNTVDGSLLPGCENVTSLARYQLDRLFVSPIDKDRVYVCNSARRVAQLVRIARRFKRYLVTIYDNSIPELGDGEMLSPLEGYLVFSKYFSALVTVCGFIWRLLQSGSGRWFIFCNECSTRRWLASLDPGSRKIAISDVSMFFSTSSDVF